MALGPVRVILALTVCAAAPCLAVLLIGQGLAYLIVVEVCVVTLGLAMLLRRLRRALPGGVVVYSDADGHARPLVSPVRPLSGKPDYILRLHGGKLVPVEFKSYRRGALPLHADVVQLGSYLVLLEDLYGHAPPYGILRYRDRSVRVPYTIELRQEIGRLLARVSEGGTSMPAGTPNPTLCHACPFMPICEAARR